MQLLDSTAPIDLKRSGGLEPKSNPPRRDICDTLIQRMLDATARMNTALRGFDLELGHCPSVGIRSIWTERICSGSRELSAARAEYINAHKRFKEFAEFGIVPIDL